MVAILSQIVNLLKENPREYLQEGTEGAQVEAEEAESTLEKEYRLLSRQRRDCRPCAYRQNH
jgi:hypothetical protein